MKRQITPVPWFGNGRDEEQVFAKNQFLRTNVPILTLEEPWQETHKKMWFFHHISQKLSGIYPQG